MHIIPHNLLSDEHVWAHPCCLTPPPHRRRTGGSSGATHRGVRFDLGGVSQLTLWRQGWTLVRFIFIICFVRLPICNKYSDYIVTFISIHSVIICVVFFGAYMRCTRLCPLKPGVTNGERSLPQSKPSAVAPVTPTAVTTSTTNDFPRRARLPAAFVATRSGEWGEHRGMRLTDIRGHDGSQSWWGADQRSSPNPMKTSRQIARPSTWKTPGTWSTWYREPP
jgi:hypothetical protein